MQKNWHSISLANVFSLVESKEGGLTSERAALRLKKNGRNALPPEKPLSKIKLLFSQFNSPLMYILLATVVISFFLKHYSDTIFIAVILFINTTVGFYQENKANKSLLLLKKMVKIRVKVLRDGNEKEIDSDGLVIGDIVLLNAGDKVPADGRIIDCKGLKINESSLTGEWLAVGKDPTAKISQKAALSERVNMVFMGTVVEEGRAVVVITAAGAATQMGEIVQLLEKTKERKTPLQRKVISLSKITAAFILLIVVAIIVVGYFTEKSFADIFVTALALAVSAIPEGLLPAITVTLVLGMRRILKKNGLVRKLVATETLGSVTVICTDKTGTLTEGKMRVSQVLTGTKELLRSGFGDLAKNGNLNGVESHISALKIAALVNEAFVENPDDDLQEWVVRGRPTDQALLLAGMQAGLKKRDLEKQYPTIDRISFDSNIKYAASLHRLNNKKNVLYVLGAPEEVIARSVNLDVDGHKQKLGVSLPDKLIKKLEDLTENGLRVVACARKEYKADVKYNSLVDLLQGLTLVGFIAIKDPLRPDAKESIAITKKAGIRAVIITGDHRLTAQAIAQEIGLEAEDKNILEGKDIEAMTDEILKEKSKYVSIYARVSPHHKLRIVRALQDNGEVVAMVGDGVNDAPALKKADIGVTVGSGTDVAKEVSDLVLLDNNFKTIVEAVEQGRVIFANIRKVFAYLVADDFSELFMFLAAMACGLPLPLLPAQIFWINLVEDGLPDIALTTEQETEGVMDEDPRSPKEPILNMDLGRWMFSVFVITGFAAFLSFLFFWDFFGSVSKARTMVFVLMCLDSLTFAFSVRSFKRSVFRKDIFSNRYLTGGVIISFILLLGAVYLPPLQKLLATQSLNLVEWLMISAVVLVEVILISISKKLVFTRKV